MPVKISFPAQRLSRDHDGFHRVVEGWDVVYSFVALNVIGHADNYGVNLVIKVPITGQMMCKLLTPEEAKKMAVELDDLARCAEELSANE